MKLLLPLLLLLTTKIQTSSLGMINPLQFQCTLSIQVSPLEYTFVTRSISLRVRFSSNCLRLRDFLFELPFTFKDRLSMKKHPKIVELDIFGNKYRLAFKDQESSDMNTILRKYRYTKVTLSPSSRPTSKNVQCNIFNRIFLEERRPGSFGVRRLNKLLYIDNPVRCRSASNLKMMKCRIR